MQSPLFLFISPNPIAVILFLPSIYANSSPNPVNWLKHNHCTCAYDYQSVPSLQQQTQINTVCDSIQEYDEALCSRWEYDSAPHEVLGNRRFVRFSWLLLHEPDYAKRPFHGCRLLSRCRSRVRSWWVVGYIRSGFLFWIFNILLQLRRHIWQSLLGMVFRYLRKKANDHHQSVGYYRTLL